MDPLTNILLLAIYNQQNIEIAEIIYYNVKKYTTDEKQKFFDNIEELYVLLLHDKKNASEGTENDYYTHIKKNNYLDIVTLDITEVNKLTKNKYTNELVYLTYFTNYKEMHILEDDKNPIVQYIDSIHNKPTTTSENKEILKILKKLYLFAKYILTKINTQEYIVGADELDLKQGVDAKTQEDSEDIDSIDIGTTTTPLRSGKRLPGL